MTNWEAVKGFDRDQFADWFTQVCLAAAGVEDPKNYHSYGLCRMEALMWMDSELETKED